MGTKVVIYRTLICPYCVMAARLLDQKNVAYEEMYLDGKPEQREALMRQTNFRTVPQIFIGDSFVGGYRELAQLERQGRLDSMLAGEST